MHIVTPLYMASYKNHIDAMQLLIDNGAVIDASTSTDSNYRMYTSLVVAFQCRHYDAVRLLLRYGANPKYIRDTHSCLINVIKDDHDDILDSVLDDVIIKKDGVYLLRTAIDFMRTKALRVLLNRGVDYHKHASWERAPLYEALKLGGEVANIVIGHHIATLYKEIDDRQREIKSWTDRL